MDNVQVFNGSHTTLHTFYIKNLLFFLPVWYKFHVDSLFRSEDIKKKKKRSAISMGYGAMIFMENLESQTLISKNHSILGQSVLNSSP